MPRHPARVHVILARHAATGIVIRRGPSKSVCTFRWDLRTDTFKLGQWLRGRIYERRCDLSPDGNHFIYFAFNGIFAASTGGSWTAISKTPYLKALGLWGNGSAWGGGGLFITDSTFWIHGKDIHTEIRLPRGLSEQDRPKTDSYGLECPGVYYVRLQRDGWELKPLADADNGKDKCTVFEKPLWKGWKLEKTAHATINPPAGKGVYFDTHRLLHENGKTVLDLPTWEWADLYKKRLFFVTDGVLCEVVLSGDGIALTKTLKDFNEMSFTPIKAPY